MWVHSVPCVHMPYTLNILNTFCFFFSVASADFSAWLRFINNLRPHYLHFGLCVWLFRTDFSHCIMSCMLVEWKRSLGDRHFYLMATHKLFGDLQGSCRATFQSPEMWFFLLSGLIWRWRFIPLTSDESDSNSGLGHENFEINFSLVTQNQGFPLSRCDRSLFTVNEKYQNLAYHKNLRKPRP